MGTQKLDCIAIGLQSETIIYTVVHLPNISNCSIYSSSAALQLHIPDFPTPYYKQPIANTLICMFMCMPYIEVRYLIPQGVRLTRAQRHRMEPPGGRTSESDGVSPGSDGFGFDRSGHESFGSAFRPTRTYIY